MKRKNLSLLVLMILLLALPLSAAQAAGPCAQTSINVREGPGGGYVRTGVINPGECITVLGLSADGNWYQISQGWVWAAPHLWSDTPTVPAPGGGPAPAPAPAGAHNVAAQGWVSDPGPAPGQGVVAYTLIAIDGAGRGGIPVEFTWGTGAGAFRCTGVTDGLGLAVCFRNVNSAPGEIVPIRGTFQAYGRGYSVATSYAVNGDCNLAYPDFCLPNGLPPQTCASIPYRNFIVLRPDPHGFDPDGNGLGCEG